MSNKSSVAHLSRAEFLQQYGDAFATLFDFERSDDQILRNNAGWERRTFGFGLWAFAWDQECFDVLMTFVCPQARPDFLVMTEVESVERFTEVLRVRCDPDALRKGIQDSVLPHFRTACLNRTAHWAVVFDNERSETIAARKLLTPPT